MTVTEKTKRMIKDQGVIITWIDKEEERLGWGAGQERRDSEPVNTFRAAYSN